MQRLAVLLALASGLAACVSPSTTTTCGAECEKLAAPAECPESKQTAAGGSSGSADAKDGPDCKSSRSHVHTDVSDNTQVDFDDGQLRQRQLNRRFRLRIPLLLDLDSANDGRTDPLPWWWSLSSNGERIMLVRELNQQVLDTDRQYMASFSRNLDRLAPSQQAISEGLDLVYKAKRASKTELSELRPQANQIINRLPWLKNQVDEVIDTSKTDAERARKAEDLEKALLNLVNSIGSIGQVNQRTTFFNMRPAAVVAAERGPSSWALGDRRILDRLDLTQIFAAAGAVLEPAVIALGVVDSIAKRIVKRDGDTEFTYVSIPTPLHNGVTSAESELAGNRAALTVSNNGKYELHFNPTKHEVAKDGPIDYENIDKYSGPAAAAIAVAEASIEIARANAAIANAAQPGSGAAVVQIGALAAEELERVKTLKGVLEAAGTRLASAEKVVSDAKAAVTAAETALKAAIAEGKPKDQLEPLVKKWDEMKAALAKAETERGQAAAGLLAATRSHLQDLRVALKRAEDAVKAVETAAQPTTAAVDAAKKNRDGIAEIEKLARELLAKLEGAAPPAAPPAQPPSAANPPAAGQTSGG